MRIPLPGIESSFLRKDQSRLTILIPDSRNLCSMFEFHVDFHSLLNDDGTPRAPHVTLILALRKIDRHAAQRRALGFYLKGQSWTNSKLLRRVTLGSK